jgi:hypothetical protein
MKKVAYKVMVYYSAYYLAQIEMLQFFRILIVPKVSQRPAMSQTTYREKPRDADVGFYSMYMHITSRRRSTFNLGLQAAAHPVEGLPTSAGRRQPSSS